MEEITVEQALQVLAKKLPYFATATGHVARTFVNQKGDWATLTVRVTNQNEATRREDDYISFVTTNRGWIDVITSLGKGDFVSALSLEYKHGAKRPNGTYGSDQLVLSEVVVRRKAEEPVATPKFLQGLVK
ncbi:hypothetical protein [Streptomyces qinglanensis]|uniref:Uncharacterized protein n=1 Tax=Streptomyces qinglanensis TaxID=943816 RepID=A0A1H9WXY8_9ACTN|nr:hypothetical protein [Streptomyces qinglanensis]SES38699.1 hypothetical protein SAMN05421870_12511 [Streptomyces qinglanensis]